MKLTRPDLENGEEIRARLAPGGDLSHDLRAGVSKVKVPDPEWDSVGGIVPDLILYGSDDTKPVRIIEVVVTRPPGDEKQQKLDALRKRGVDVVVITVKEKSDLLNLCPLGGRPNLVRLPVGIIFQLTIHKTASGEAASMVTIRPFGINWSNSKMQSCHPSDPAQGDVGVGHLGFAVSNQAC